MHAPEQITVSRTITLDASVDDVWRLLTDDAELSGWLADAATLDVVPGGVGHFHEGSTSRRAVVHAVEHGRRLGFTWWDEADPDDASAVELVMDTVGDGQVRLTVTETLAPTGGGVGARACSWIDAVDAWDTRLAALGERIGDMVGARRPLFAG